MFRSYSMLVVVAMLLIVGAGGNAVAQTPEELLALEDASRVVFNAHDVDGFLSYFTDDAVFDYVATGMVMSEKDQMKAFFESVFEAFPDYQDVSPHRLAHGNTVVTECLPTGTHQGEWNGIPGTGLSTVVPHLSIYEYEGDKIKKLTTYDDGVTVMIQLGQMPAGEMPSLEPSFELPEPEPTGLSPLEAQVESMDRWNSGDMASWAKGFKKDARVFYNVLGTPIDISAATALQEIYFVGFSDIQGEIVRMVDMGDGWVLTEAIFRGTHDGPYFGVPGSGNLMVNRVAWLIRVDADGLSTNFHIYFDNLGVLIQIGAIPAPGTVVTPSSWGEIKAQFQTEQNE